MVFLQWTISDAPPPMTSDTQPEQMAQLQVQTEVKRGHPCRVPLCKEKAEETSLLVHTPALGLVYKSSESIEHNPRQNPFET